jgi:uncharacterized protein (TIGR00645 family)
MPEIDRPIDQPADRSKLARLEKITERVLFASRWLLAPFYLGLVFALLILLLKFLQELWRIGRIAVWASEVDVILGVLSLVDLVLMGTLIVIVVFSGYENFVSKIDHAADEKRPTWMGSVDFATLKLKLLSSIVAISAIHLLKKFMDVSKIPDRELYWYAMIHAVFVGSMLLLALSDRISGHVGNNQKADTGNQSKPAADPRTGPAHEREQP